MDSCRARRGRLVEGTNHGEGDGSLGSAASVSALRTALAASRVRDDSTAWALLRRDHAAVMVALLHEHLGGEVRRRHAPDLFERVDHDLVELRAHGFAMPRPARDYCDDWRAAGVLVRRPVEGTREETLELSDGALQAIRFVMAEVDPVRAVTESRLATILSRLSDLAIASDPSATTRLAALAAERERIDAEIARVSAGDFEPLPAERAVERVREILALADGLPTDFARVRAELDELNRSLRARLVDDVDSRGQVLDDIFRGVDHVAESEAGRSFDGFYALLLDAERLASFEDDVEQVLERPLAGGLTAAQVRTLRRLLPTLQDSSGEIHAVMTALARSLRRFVQTDELAEHRQLNRLLRAAQRSAGDLAPHVQPFARTGLTLDLPSVPIDSVGSLTLLNPADQRTADDVETVTDGGDIAWEELVDAARASEIDFDELRRDVNAALALRGAVTTAEVLEAYPPSQGLASVVGLLVLAEEHGTLIDGRDPVAWETGGRDRRGWIPRHLFTEEIA